jgi:hypothetical protein
MRINHQKRNNQQELDVHGQGECRRQDVLSFKGDDDELPKQKDSKHSIPDLPLLLFGFIFVPFSSVISSLCTLCPVRQ